MARGVPGSERLALTRALQRVPLATAPRKRLVYYGLGLGNCPGDSGPEYLEEVLETIEALNIEKIPFEVVAANSDANFPFLERMVEITGGFLRRWQR